MFYPNKIQKPTMPASTYWLKNLLLWFTDFKRYSCKCTQQTLECELRVNRETDLQLKHSACFQHKGAPCAAPQQFTPQQCTLQQHKGHLSGCCCCFCFGCLL